MYEHTEDTLAIIELTRKLVEKHQRPLERRVLRGETLADEDFHAGTQEARELGLWGLTAPLELGGAGISIVDYLAIIEAVSKCIVPLRFGGSCALPNLYALEGEQKARYLDPILDGSKELCFAQSETNGASDPARGIRARAKQDGDDWIINGEKVWISNFETADFVFVVARTDADNAKGAGGISMLVVEKDNPGMTARAVQMLGTHVTHQLTFEDCRVDKLALIGGEGSGFAGAQKALSAARFEVGARALGQAQQCYEMMVEFAKERELFGSRLSEKQAIQAMIVESWVEIQQHRLMLYACAEKADRGDDTRLEAALVKMTCTEMADRVIDRAVQIHGANGCTYESPLGHLYDAARLARIYEGPTEVHKYRVLARQLLR